MLPQDFKYTRSHEWVNEDGECFTAGITFFAQEQLGDITFVELPEVGKIVERGGEMAVVESVKAASEIYAPISGEIIAVNTDLEDAPELINEDPFGKGWIVRIKSATTVSNLLSADEYALLIQGD
ncbi:MAG: glycine cleavage system protein GcvH [Desulfonatronovibrio sp.]|nr:glycine cleavage system protein GcvH [Desulfovibrionales bacterium]